MDIGWAVMVLLLAAVNEGLAAGFAGAHDLDALRELLGLDCAPTAGHRSQASLIGFPHALSTQNAPYLLGEARRTDRLADEAVEARRSAALHILRQHTRRHRDYRCGLQCWL